MTFVMTSEFSGLTDTAGARETPQRPAPVAGYHARPQFTAVLVRETIVSIAAAVMSHLEFAPQPPVHCMSFRSFAIDPDASIRIRTSGTGRDVGRMYRAQLCPPAKPPRPENPPDDDPPDDDPPDDPPSRSTEPAPPASRGGRAQAITAASADASENR